MIKCLEKDWCTIFCISLTKIQKEMSLALIDKKKEKKKKSFNDLLQFFPRNLQNLCQSH